MSLTRLPTFPLQVKRPMLVVRRAVTTGIIALTALTSLAGADGGQPGVQVQIAEGSPAGTQLGVIADPDRSPSGSLSEFVIAAGNDDGAFAIDAETGVLRVRDGAALDFERQAGYELRVRAVQRGLDDAARRRFAADLLQSGVDDAEVAELLRETVEFAVVVTVLDAAEPPVLPAQRVTLIWSDDVNGAGESAGIRALDDDAGDALRYEILAGDSQGLLQIDPETGRLSAATQSELPVGRHSLPVTVRVTDSTGHSDAATLTVDVIRLSPPVLLANDSPEAAVEPVAAAEEPSAAAIQAAPVDVPADAESGTAPVAIAGPVQSAPPAVDDQSATSQAPAASESDLVSRFVPILLMLGAGVLTTLFLRRRQRARAQIARETLQHGADVLARPLPGWLSASQPSPRHPLVISVPAHVDQPNADAELIAIEDAVVEPEVVDVLTEVEEAPRSMEDTVIVANLERQPPARQDADVEPVNEFAEPADDPASSSTWSPHDLFAGVETPLTQQAIDVSEPEREQADAPWSAAAADHAESGAYVDDEFVVGSENRPASSEGYGAADETYALQDEVYELEGTSDDRASQYDDEGSYVGGWTQDDELPYDNSEVSAVQDASAALEESGSPLGIDPRVAELRAQLSNLFGVSLSASRPPEPPLDDAGEPPPFVDETEYAQADEAVAEEAITEQRGPEQRPAERFDFESESAPAPADQAADAMAPAPSDADSDPVRSWLEYLKNRNAPAPSASTEAKPAAVSLPAAAAPVSKPQAPPVQVSATKSVPMVRQNKSAVRLEISHLRDVANRHTRGVLAVKASEQKARLWWFLSGASMVVLCFISMALLKSGTPIVRWIGWAFLCGAAVNLAVCVNSFQRLKTRADADEEGESAETSARTERAGDVAASDLLTPEMEARLESILQTDDEPTPVESHT